MFMKIIISILITIFFTSCKEKIPANAKTETFKVWGNCGMCEETIEGSLKEEGIFKADWDQNSKIMVVSYDPAKYDLVDLHKKIAVTGYDTEMEKGNDEAYNNRPECCKYERKPQPQ